MITSLQPFFPHEHPPTLLPRLIEANRHRLPGATFAYFRIRTFHDFCLDANAVVATDREAVRAIVARASAVLLDVGHEGPMFNAAFAGQLARFANMYAVPPRKLVVLSTNERFLADLRAHAATPRISAEVRWVWFHHYLVQLLQRAERRRLPALGHAQVAAPAGRTVPFLALNATPRAHRALLAYLIATQAAREKFVCSFTLGGPKANFAHLRNVVEPMAARFGTSWAAMEPVLRAHRFDATRLADLAPADLVGELEPELYARTRVSLVTETEMTAGEIVRTTEKIFKPLLLGQPVVAFANPGTLALLRALGVDTFDDHLDNRYDAIADPAERFTAAWRVVETLLADDAAFAVDPTVANRLSANVALFEGALLRTVTDRTLGELAAALA